MKGEERERRVPFETREKSPPSSSWTRLFFPSNNVFNEA